MSEQSETQSSEGGGLIASGLIAAAVASVGLMIPLFHFFWFFVGPVAGGFIGGMRSKASSGEAGVIAAIMGLAFGGVAGVVGYVLITLEVINQPMSMAAAAAGAGLAYGALGGGIGAFLGGNQARK